MPVDIRALRDHPDDFRESQRGRFKDDTVIDDFLKFDAHWRVETDKLCRLRANLAQVQKHIAECKKASKGRDDPQAEQAVREKKGLDEEISSAERSQEVAECDRSEALARIGSLLCESVPRAPTEQGNTVLRSWGPRGVCVGVANRMGSAVRSLHHWELLTKLGACDMERGTRVAGRRGYYLKGVGVLLNMALQSYGISFLAQRGYTALQPPFFMRKEVMAKTAELSDFDEQLYKVSSKKEDADPVYLIATSEQPLSAFHQNEVLKPSDLPLRYAGVSPCFRAESGSHGLDAKGLFRVHQFEKVEQFCIASPEDSWAMFHEMVSIAEGFYQSLGLPYQVVAIASGALNNAAAMKYDIEAWFPGQQEYRELVSCSNCTDFQARALNVRLDEGPRSRRHVHMLNATLCATQRTLCCLVENFQDPCGVRVPPPLVPYMHGMEYLRFTDNI